jgi:4-amino-4-deoxy-L-arabinose transferase-like glycosyltransferase
MRPRHAPVWLVRTGVFAAFFIPYLAVVLSLQISSGAYRSELSQYPDEAGHVVSALMVHDYLVSGFTAPPLPFAKNYYIHYPKVAIGMWPPAFHGAAGVWMLLFGATQPSLLGLMATIGALLASTLALFALRIFGAVIAFALGLLLIALPVVRKANCMVMLDVLVALLAFWSLWMLIRFFRNGQTRAAAAFGGVAALTMLTKANGNALVFVPVFLIALARRRDLLKRRGLYVAALIIAGIGLPWQVVSFKMIAMSLPVSRGGVPFAFKMLALYLGALIDNVGLGVFLVALLGLGVEAVKLMRKSADASLELGGAVCLLTAVVLFHSLNPWPGEERYMLAALPMLLLCFAAGVRSIARILSERLPFSTSVTALGAALFLLAFVGRSYSIPPLPELGFARTAAFLSSPAMRDEVLLVCSDANGEGAFIVEMALRDRRPQRIILRASKVLGDNTWFATEHRPNFRTAEELSRFLDSVPVGTIVVDRTNSLWPPDLTLLLQALDRSPAQWSLALEIPASTTSRNILAYRRTKPLRDRGIHVQIPMKYTLGGALELRR